MKVYLTCAGRAGQPFMGPGKRLSIMAFPPEWAREDGKVLGVAPSGEVARMMQAALEARKNPLFQGREPINRYQRAYEEQLQRLLDRGDLAPGRLGWRTPDGRRLPVDDGDNLLCTCQPGEECHRVWLASFLTLAGWVVVLDVVEHKEGEK